MTATITPLRPAPCKCGHLRILHVGGRKCRGPFCRCIEYRKDDRR